MQKGRRSNWGAPLWHDLGMRATVEGAAMTVDDAKKIAHGLIQGYIGPDHRVMDMRSALYSTRSDDFPVPSSC
jgi:hypothetical protein